MSGKTLLLTAAVALAVVVAHDKVAKGGGVSAIRTSH
jgi:hypothetical protein